MSLDTSHAERFARMLRDLDIVPAALIADAAFAIVDGVAMLSVSAPLGNQTLAEGLISAVKLAAALGRLLEQARAVVDAVQRDDAGQLVAGEWRGGSGGLLSRDTLKAVDALRLELSTWVWA